eukprot:gene34976-44829_t
MMMSLNQMATERAHGTGALVPNALCAAPLAQMNGHGNGNGGYGRDVSAPYGYGGANQNVCMSTSEDPRHGGEGAGVNFKEDETCDERDRAPGRYPPPTVGGRDQVMYMNSESSIGLAMTGARAPFPGSAPLVGERGVPSGRAFIMARGWPSDPTGSASIPVVYRNPYDGGKAPSSAEGRFTGHVPIANTHTNNVVRPPFVSGDNGSAPYNRTVGSVTAVERERGLFVSPTSAPVPAPASISARHVLSTLPMAVPYVTAGAFPVHQAQAQGMPFTYWPRYAVPVPATVNGTPLA